MQQVDEHLEQTDFTENVAEYHVMPAELQQRTCGCDAASVTRAWLQQDADAKHLFAGDVVKRKHHKLEQLKVFDLDLWQARHSVGKLGECVLSFQDEVVGVIGRVNVCHSVQDHTGETASPGLQEGVLQHGKGLNVPDSVTCGGKLGQL